MKKNIFLFSIVVASASFCTAQDSTAKRNQQMKEMMMIKPKYPIKTIGIYVYDGFNTLDAIGPYQVLSQLMNVKVFLIAKQKGLIRNQTGLKMKVDTSIDNVTHLDMLIIPGGARETFMQTQDTAVLNWIKKIDATSTYTCSVCTGGWILGATGLLKGKKAAANWYRANEMMDRYGASFQNERYVQDGKYWTSAGVSAGMDMCLAIVNELMGKQYTQAVMLDLEYNPHPPVEGGTVSNSEPEVVELMQALYDRIFLPLIQQAEKKR